MEFAVNVELMFTETAGIPGRIRAAAAAGFTLVELWRWSEVDCDAVSAALEETGCQLVCATSDWTIAAGDPAQSARLRDELRAGLAAVASLGGRFLVAALGSDVVGISRGRQVDVIAGVLSEVADDARHAGVGLLVEPVNARVDHPGTLLTSTQQAVALLERIGRDEVRLLFDAYHVAAEGDQIEASLRLAAPYLGYVQIADHPGRGEPGTGEIDWRDVGRALQTVGYGGPIGLELTPRTTTTAAVAAVRAFEESIRRVA